MLESHRTPDHPCAQRRNDASEEQCNGNAGSKINGRSRRVIHTHARADVPWLAAEEKDRILWTRVYDRIRTINNWQKELGVAHSWAGDSGDIDRP